MDDAQCALIELGRALAASGYQFVTPTPETHRRVFARRALASDLRDVFGWSRPFERALLPAAWLRLLERADALEVNGSSLRARIRFSTLDAGLYVHAAYPTVASDSVFFGPDTYRFCRFVARAAPRAERVVDVGCGSGAGGLVAARAAGARELSLVDVNPRALRFAEVNVQLANERGPESSLARGTARFDAQFVLSDVLAGVTGQFDLIVANPPYMRDCGQRTYRDGGGEHGEALSIRIVRESLARLSTTGTLLLYTGSAIVEGQDVFLCALREALEGWAFRYEELDPDVFGEELEQPGYERVERIAAVGLTVRRPD